MPVERNETNDVCLEGVYHKGNMVYYDPKSDMLSWEDRDTGLIILGWEHDVLIRAEHAALLQKIRSEYHNG